MQSRADVNDRTLRCGDAVADKRGRMMVIPLVALPMVVATCYQNTCSNEGRTEII